jgi:multidrug efflux pump subunit AcrB
MKISELAVKNYQFTIVLFLLLVSLGVYSYLKIPQAEDPEFPLAIYPIFAVYPGASPQDIEEMVIEKVEKSLNELEDIYKLTSDIREGIGIIVIEFNSGADADKKYDEIVRQINSVRSELPPDLYSIEALKLTAGNTNIVQSAIVSENASYGQLGGQAEELRDRISELEGIRSAEAMAYPEREVSVEIDLPKMANLKITVSQVIGALQSASRVEVWK